METKPENTPPTETPAVVPAIATAENNVNTSMRSVSKAFKEFVKTPSVANRNALNAITLAISTPGSDADKALNAYRAEFVKANFS